MAQTVTLTAKGLELTRNDLSSGGLAAADNCVLGRDGILECRPGFTVANAIALTHLAPFKGRLLGFTGAALAVSSADATSWSLYAGTLSPPVGSPLRMVEACESIFLTTSTGAYRLDTIAGTPGLSGVPAALYLDGLVQSANPSGPLPADSQVAYRVVWGKRDGNNRVLIGAPSSRAVLTNSNSDIRNAELNLAIPRDVDGTYFVQVYRSAPSASATVTPDDEMGLVYEAPAITAKTTTNLTRAANLVTVTTSTPHGYAANQYVSVAPGDATFPAGAKLVISTPTSTTFTYGETGADGSLATAQTVTPLSMVIVDSLADGLSGAALYTNPAQEGIDQAAERPPLARDLAYYKGYTFYLATQDPPVVSGALVGLPANNDTITINGITYTAKTAGGSESVQNRNFQVVSGSTPARNLWLTLQSLIRVVTIGRQTNAVALDLTTADTVGTAFALRAIDAATGVTVSVSRPLGWSFSGSSAESPKQRQANLRWSRAYEPDAVPLHANEATVGSDDKAGLRVIPTRDAVYVLKEDGVFILRGDAPPWDIRPLDPTIRLVAPESAVSFDNSVWALTEQGVVRISDTGVTVMSRAIESALLPLVGPAMRATTETYAFAVGYESARRYLLWMPASATDAIATQAFAFDLFTQQWTRWADPDAAHAVVNPVDDRLYVASIDGVLQERKGYAAADYQDASGASIPVDVIWNPPSPNVGALNHYQELLLNFSKASFTTATVSFATDLSPAWEAVTLNGSDYALDGGSKAIRVSVPKEKRRGSQLRIRFQHSQSSAPVALQALTLSYRPGSPRVSR